MTEGGTKFETRQQLAQRCGLSLRTLEALATRGDGPAFVRVGRRCLYPVDATDEWLRARMVSSTSERVAA
jgi:hypothetical protein